LANYRVKYERGDNVRFISHLDMLSLFSRAARRAMLPISYSEGYNPHPKFVFGMPLPVGVTSEDEYVDIQLDTEIPASSLVDILNNAIPQGVKIINAVLLDEHAPNIMKTVVASKYRIVALLPNEKYAQNIIEKFKSGCELVIMKRTKSGTKETDIRPMLFDFAIENISDEPINDKIKVSFLAICAAGNTNNLRPELALEALCEDFAQCSVTKIHRIVLMTPEDMKI